MTSLHTYTRNLGLYSSPTIIYNQPITTGFIAVTDVSGTHAVQVYRTHKNGTSLESSETYSDGRDAIARAKTLYLEFIDQWAIDNGFGE